MEVLGRAYRRLLEREVLAPQDGPFLSGVSAETFSVIQGAAKLCHLLHQVLTALRNHTRKDTFLHPTWSKAKYWRRREMCIRRTMVWSSSA